MKIHIKASKLMTQQIQNPINFFFDSDIKKKIFNKTNLQLYFRKNPN